MRIFTRCFALGVAMTVVSEGSTILVNPTGITYSTLPNQEENGFGGALNNEANLINGSGLSGAPDISNYTTITHSAVSLSAPGNSWATVDTPPGGGDFFNEGGVAPIFTIDLGGAFTLDGLVAWGYHFGANNGNFMQTSTLEFSSDGGGSYHTTLPGVTTLFPGAPDLATVANFAPVNANFVRLTVVDNHFEGAGGGDRVGIAELRFLAVPEPSTSLLGALAALALLRRRR